MSVEQQAPYLARNEAAIDALLAAYDKLYTELDAMRSFCENPDTPYENPEYAANTEWYRNFNAQLTELTGSAHPLTCEDALQTFDAMLQYLDVEYSQIEFPADFADKWYAYTPKTTEEYYNETIALLEKEYGALTDTFDTRILPDVEYFGNLKVRYFYDQPDHSALFFRQRADASGILMRYVACNHYFFRYMAQQTGLSRAQLLSAPDGYFSGLGFYHALELTKAEAERTGDYTEWYTLFMSVYEYTMRAYIACLIAISYDKAIIMQDLTDYFGMPKENAISAYDDARAMPFTMINLTYGFARLYLMNKLCRVKLGGLMDDRAFMERYLSFGPSFPDILEEKMQEWISEVRSSI